MRTGDARKLQSSTEAMMTGEGGWLAQLGRGGLWLCLLAGCAHAPPAVQNTHSPSAARPGMGDHYQVPCPALLEAAIRGVPLVREKIDADGRLDLGGLGNVCVEGLTRPEIDRRIAAAVGALPSTVHVQVAEYNSQQIFIFGEVHGLQRAVPYRGE